MRRGALAVLLLVWAVPAHAGRSAGRQLGQQGRFDEAAAAYSTRARSSDDAPLLGEYGYALARAGFHDLALAQLDRGLHTAGAHPEYLHFASRTLRRLGMGTAADELDRPAPAWAQNLAADVQDPPERDLGATRAELQAANVLMRQGRFYSAAYRFHRITNADPEEALAWSGKAIALEKIGAFKTAAEAVGRDLDLNPKMDAASSRLLSDHRQELQSRGPLRLGHRPRPNEMLKGRYLCFVGGDYTKNEADQALTVRSRFGKFLTNRFDVAVNAGLTTGHEDGDYNGVDLGLSARYQQPLPTDAPVNAVAGTRLAYVPGPDDKLTLYLSPGLSYYTGVGSIDLFLDLAVAGPLKDSHTLSLGYTAYFGGD